MSHAVREIKSLTIAKRDRKNLTTLWGLEEGQGNVV
jgi:hypothetical protein